MHRTHGLSGLLRKLAAAALLGALVLGAGPARGQALRTPYVQPIETGPDTRHRGLQQAQQDLAEFVVGNHELKAAASVSVLHLSTIAGAARAGAGCQTLYAEGGSA